MWHRKSDVKQTVGFAWDASTFVLKSEEVLEAIMRCCRLEEVDIGTAELMNTWEEQGRS